MTHPGFSWGIPSFHFRFHHPEGSDIMSPDNEIETERNPNAPKGNVPDADGYDPTKEQDVPHSGPSTPQHTEVGVSPGTPVKPVASAEQVDPRAEDTDA